jgi:outer membrane receptor protein involved in Fe transport
MRAEKSWEFSPQLQFRVGTENRYDDIDKVGVQQTSARQFVSSFGLYTVKEASAAVYGEATWEPLTGLRIIGGLRGDYYHSDVSAHDAAAAAIGTGKDGDGVVSPKIDVAYKVSDHIELYADWGRGFHSNDVRGNFTTTPVPILVKGTGKELGARFQAGHFTLTTTYWWLNVGSELRFVGDSNAVEPTGASKRHGYEVVGFWRPLPWLAIDGNYTGSHARYDNGDHIPNAFENSASLGLSAVSDTWEGSIRLRHLGPSPLVEDNSIRDKGSTVVNLRAARKFANFEVYGDLLNIFNSRDKDITYFYEAYVPAFDPAPAEGRMSRVVEPRTVRVGATYRF